MKNVQIIDGAANCTYSIYAFTDTEFEKFFPGAGQDIEFINEAFDRIGEREASTMLSEVWKRPIKKPNVIGIHGTLFYGLDKKRKYYPSKSEQDIAGPPHSPSQR